jgi:hypothetical protein
MVGFGILIFRKFSFVPQWAFVHFRASIGDPASGWGQVKIGVCEHRSHQLALDNTSPGRPLDIQVPRYVLRELFRKTKDV